MITKKCTTSGQEFIITDEDQAFYQKMDVPVPTLCPEAQIRELMAHRNEWNLFRRKCDKTGDTIISAYPDKVPFPVWNNALWWGDEWEALDYGRDFDFNRHFFDQFQDLQNVVPREGTTVFRSENCAFNGHIRDSKNCYLNSLVARCEDTHYSYWVVDNKDVVDCVMANNSELCYDCVDIEHCYDCVKLYESSNCNDCYFSFQLRGCKNCIGCSNLQNKSYHVFNKPVSKEEFEAMKAKVLNGSYKTYLEGEKFLEKVFAETPHRACSNINSENVTGNHMHSSRNCENCFDGHSSEDCKDSVSLEGNDVHRSYSAGWPRCELIYASAVSRGSTNLAFCYYTFFSQDLRYCDSCNYCQDCFGCVGLKHKKYCILNKQYTKDEYEKLLPQIISHMEKTEEWGKFFSISKSVFAYNKSVAQDYYPIEKEDCLGAGYNWSDEPESATYDGTGYALPDDMKDIDESVCDKILECNQMDKNYRIVKPEYAFCKKMNLPLPRSCPAARHQGRMAMRNSRKLWEAKCDKCHKAMKSSFSPESLVTVFCEDCYLESIE